MATLPAGSAAVTRWLTLEQTLAGLAQEIDPERCRALAAADEDLQRIFAPSMFNWSPLADALRLDEFKRTLLAELLGCLQQGSLLIRILPDDGTAPVPLHEDQIAALTPQSFDVAKPAIILGTRRFRVQIGIGTEPERTAAPHTPEAAAISNTRLQARYNARVTPEHVPTVKEDRAWAKAEGISQEQVEELRRNNPDRRLHERHRRRR